MHEDWNKWDIQENIVSIIDKSRTKPYHIAIDFHLPFAQYTAVCMD